MKFLIILEGLPGTGKSTLAAMFNGLTFDDTELLRHWTPVAFKQAVQHTSTVVVCTQSAVLLLKKHTFQKMITGMWVRIWQVAKREYLPIPTAYLSSPPRFRALLLSHGNYTWEGGARELARLRRELSDLTEVTIGDILHNAKRLRIKITKHE